MGRRKNINLSRWVNLLRQIEVAVANGKTTAQACKEAGIVKQTYFRWPFTNQVAFKLSKRP